MRNILFSDSCRKNCWGGVEKWVLMMAQSLRQRGYHTYLMCRPESILQSKASENAIPADVANYTNSFDLFTVLQIMQVIHRHRIDLIVCATNLDIKLAGLAGKLTGIPVVSRQGLALIKNSYKYRFLVRHFTTSIITNTDSIKKQYETYGWFPPDFIKVIPNGIYPPQKTTVAKDLKCKLQTSPSHKIILSAGRLNTQKGFEYLIETAQMAQATQQKWDFILLGSGKLEVELKNKISELGLKNIKLMGFKKNIHEYYLCADVFVLSSIAEGTPNVVLEAMSYKCPVIATDVDGVKDIIINQKSGWIVPARNSSAIYHALQECFADPERSRKIAEEACYIACNKYTIKNTTDRFIEYITQIFAKYEKDHHKNA